MRLGVAGGNCTATAAAPALELGIELRHQGCDTACMFAVGEMGQCALEQRVGSLGFEQGFDGITERESGMFLREIQHQCDAPVPGFALLMAHGSAVVEQPERGLWCIYLRRQAAEEDGDEDLRKAALQIVQHEVQIVRVPQAQAACMVDEALYFDIARAEQLLHLADVEAARCALRHRCRGDSSTSRAAHA